MNCPYYNFCSERGGTHTADCVGVGVYPLDGVALADAVRLAVGDTERLEVAVVDGRAPKDRVAVPVPEGVWEAARTAHAE